MALRRAQHFVADCRSASSAAGDNGVLIDRRPST